MADLRKLETDITPFLRAASRIIARPGVHMVGRVMFMGLSIIQNLSEQSRESERQTHLSHG